MDLPGKDVAYGLASDSALIARLREVNKNLLYAAVTARDSQIEAEGALQNQDRFLAVLAHELRNPLTPINLVATALGAFSEINDRLLRLQQTLTRQLGHLSYLVNTLDDVTRIKSGKLQLDMQLVRLADAVLTAFDMIRPLTDARGQQLDIWLPAESLMVRGDVGRLVQVFSNLLSNATKFTPEHGIISVKMERKDACATITIKDSGTGISHAFQPFMFDIFAQDGIPQSHSRAGSGIGLSLVRSLVELHGGQVAIVSGMPGEGCTAIVTLPLALT